MRSSLWWKFLYWSDDILLNRSPLDSTCNCFNWNACFKGFPRICPMLMEGDGPSSRGSLLITQACSPTITLSHKMPSILNQSKPGYQFPCCDFHKNGTLVLNLTRYIYPPFRSHINGPFLYKHELINVVHPSLMQYEYGGLWWEMNW